MAEDGVRKLVTSAWPAAASSLTSAAFKNVLVLALVAATALKLWIAARTFGTNDVKYWQTFMHYLVENDSVSIYREIDHYNHPPFMSVFLRFSSLLTARHPELFPFLLRVPAIFADVASALCVQRLVRRFASAEVARRSALIVALSPVLVCVSGFHGNTDPVFVLILLLATESLVVKQRPALAGLLYGFSLNIKIVPLLCGPHFAALSSSFKERFKFFATAALAALLGFGYHFLKDARGITENVFLYQSNAGCWGLSQLFQGHAWLSWLRLVLFGALCVAASLLWQRVSLQSEVARVRAACTGLGLVFLIFLVVTPGFGVQYLSWLAVTGVLLGNGLALIYNLLGGLFLFLVYTYWSGGFPWFNADSDIIGPWRGPSEIVGLVLWAYLVLWLGFALVRFLGLPRRAVFERS